MAKMMKAAVVEKPNKLVIKQVPVPEIADDEVLIKVKYTGICGTDWSIYTGKYSADKLPLIAGHEFSGTVAQVGKKARGLKEGDRVTADINMSCGTCFYCRQGQKLMCRDFHQLGIHVDGTYAEYVKAPFDQVHMLPDNLDFLAGAFVEPVSCVIHSSKAAKVTHGSSVAVIGSGLGVLHGAAGPPARRGPRDRDRRQRQAPGHREGVGRGRHDQHQGRQGPGGRGEEAHRGPRRGLRGGGRGHAADLRAGLRDGAPRRHGGGLRHLRRGRHHQVRPFDLVLGEKNVVGSCAGVGPDWPDAIALLAHGHIKPQACSR